MNWKLVALLSLFGLAMGVATVFVIPSNIEPAFWLAIFVTCAVILARRGVDKPFLHGLCVSLANCVWVTGSHVLFYDTYLANHPAEAAMTATMPLPGRVMMLVMGPVIGVVSGIVLGLFSWIASKIVKPGAGVQA